ncbi:MAG: hypothetical protein JST86_07055 [Bacteroidetes bacterium]|nr:hypothetical protein [Bacteroidota bacterium]
MLKKICCIILSACFTVSATAQAGTNAVLYTLTEKDGLTDNVANCFFQDSCGVMWIGTNYGLNSFDGSVITTFRSGTAPGTLPDNAINDIREDEHRTLWIATGNGLASYSLNQHSFMVFRYDSNNAVLNRYYSIAINGNNIYIATEEGLLLFNIPAKKFSLYKSKDGAANRITKIFIDHQKKIWLGTYAGLWQFNSSTNTFVPFDTPANDPQYDELVTDILEDHSGQLWFGCWNKGLKKWNAASGNIESLLNWKNSNGNITSIAEQKNADGHYSLWQTAGLCKPDSTLHTFVYLENGHKPITGNRLYCDRNNVLWISTNEGVKIYNPAKQYFHTTILSSYVPLTSQGIALYPMKNEFLLGGEGGTALILFSDSVKLIKNYSASVSNGAAIMFITRDTKDQFWLCSSNGLFIFDSSLKKKEWLIHNDKDYTSLPKNFLNYVLHRKDGSTWILPWRKGVWTMDLANKKFYRVTTTKGDTLLPSSNLSKALEDVNGNIWISDFSGGIFKYKPSTGAVKNLIRQRRFSNEYLAKNKLWTVSSYEVFAVDISTDSVERYPLPEGKNKYEYDFIPDQNGWLWIATKTGLLAFNTSTKQFKSFTADDGLYNNDLDINFAILSDGNILMASGTTAVTFSPSIVQQEVTPPHLIFTAAKTDEKEVSDTGGVLTFSWNEKSIQFNWALLNYSNPLGNLYYYKLDGIDRSWQFAGNRGQVIFNSLEPGSYLFHYKGATSDGVMSEEKTIRIIIRPPFWKTWWFILLSISCIAALFYAAVKYISQRNLKEQLLLLEKEQAVEKERNRISRDMHDELGSGLTKIAILTEVIKTTQEGNEHIDKISETARGLVDNLDEMVWALNPQNDSLDKLAAYIAEYANQFMDGSGIDCNITLPDEISPLYISEEKRRNLFMVVKEFLNNTIKHSGAKNVWVQLKQFNQHFELLLQDDGHGFDINQTSETGNGLKNIQQRIAGIGGTAVFDSSDKGTSLQIKIV